MVKIYISDISKYRFNEEMLQKFLFKEEKYQYFISLDGIFKIFKDNVYKIKNNDLDYKKKTIHNVELLMDYSYQTKKESYYIPALSNKLDIKAKVYQLREKSNLKLYIEKINNNIYDIYFISNKLDDYNLNEELESFLKMLN